MKKYTYIDKRVKPEKFLFAVAATMIAEADEIFREVTGESPFQEGITTKIEDIKNETAEN